VLVGASDSSGSVADPQGLDINQLVKTKRAGGKVTDAEGRDKGDRDAVLDIACDIWIPAARPDVVRADNVDRLRTKLVLQGANIPVSAAAEDALRKRGIVSVPDFIANAGGVICAAVEYAGGSETAALATIEEKVARNTSAVLEAASASELAPREAAQRMARERVEKAMRYRRDG
jgi:glutamate dehydrogenase (NAD(P)+)